MSKLKLPPHVRIAIWRAHDKRCIYCGEPIAFTNLDIEHIVPESLLKDPQEFARVKTEYGLPADFNLNGLLNLVPAHHRPCNLSKSARVFNAARARYFLEIAETKEAKVARYVESGLLTESKEKLLASVAISIERGTLTLEDIENALSDSTPFRLSTELAFADGSSQQQILADQIEALLDKPIQLGGPASAIDGVEFVSDSGSVFTVRTCREYRAALSAGYYAGTTFAMKMEGFLSSVDGVLRAVSTASFASVSYVSNPPVGLADLELLPPDLLPVFGPKEDHPQQDLKAQSLGDLLDRDRIVLKKVSTRTLCFEWSGAGAFIRELLRADFDQDGVEELLVSYHLYAIGGTLGISHLGVLKRMGPHEMFSYCSY